MQRKIGEVSRERKRVKEKERERVKQRGRTAAQQHIQCGRHQSKKSETRRRAPTSQVELFVIILIWWAARSQTHWLFLIKAVCVGLYNYIFIHIDFLYKCFFSTFKNTTSKEMHKNMQNHNCLWHLIRAVTMNLLLCTLRGVWYHLHTTG